jgi:TPR repeat protein
MTRRLIPKFAVVTENAGRGAVISGVFHASLLGGLIIAAPQLFGKPIENFEVPITIEIFDGVYKEPEPPADAVIPAEGSVTIETAADPETPDELAKPEDVPEITVPDVRSGAIEAAARGERPADSGHIPTTAGTGDVAVVYERGAPLTPRQEVGASQPPKALRTQSQGEALPETSREIDAEIRRIRALTAQAQVRERVASGQKNAADQADAKKKLEVLERRLKRLTVAKAAAKVPKAAPSEAARSAPKALSGQSKTRLATANPEKSLSKTVTPRQKSAPKADELPEPPLPKLSAAEILKQSERRETKQAELSPADKARAKQSLERFRKAAKDGIKSAEMNVARALDKGKGVKKDPKKATKILERLARNNYQPAQIELAKKLLTGDGVKKDRKRAYILLKTASDENNIVARRALKALNKELDAKERQLAEKEAGKWRRFIKKQRAENKVSTSHQRKLDNDLRVAVDKGNVQRMESLLRSGADPNAIDASGRDAIIAAAWRGREMVVEFLIDKGVDIDTIDLEGRTPLIWASINGYQSIVEDLLTQGANPDARDDTGLTPLMRAAWNGHSDVVRTLLENGASSLIMDGEGKTALDRAREEDYKQVVQVLEGYPRAN